MDEVFEGMGRLSREQLREAMLNESTLFEEYYLWLDKHMPPSFFEDIEQRQLMLIAHNLMNFPLQDNYVQIFFKDCAIVLLLDSPDADLKILKHFNLYGIKNYQTFVSNSPPPFSGITQKLRVAFLYFTEIQETLCPAEDLLSKEVRDKIFHQLKDRNPDLEFEEFQEILCGMNHRFLRSLTQERLMLAMEMFMRAKKRDHCQYELRYNEDWHTKSSETPSLQIVLAWRNVPKNRILYKLAKAIYRHNLVMKRVNAAYINPYGEKSILMMSIGLHGSSGKAAWEEADVHDLMQEIVTLKFFADHDAVETNFVSNNLIRGNLGNLIRCMISFVHQTLTHADANLYSFSNIEEGICRHPELTVKLCEAFEKKFHPVHHSAAAFEKDKKAILDLINSLDTGQQLNDIRRKNILFQALNFIDYTVKTNFYRNNKSSMSFRLDPEYLNHVPFDRTKKFPQLPFAIFFVRGMSFMGFHIRFKDLSRGGIRTVIPQKLENYLIERNNVFSECYNLAYTQQKKNKDIPEGGSKGVILVDVFEQLEYEVRIYKQELKQAKTHEESVNTLLDKYRKDLRLKMMYQSQRAFVYSILILVNCDEKQNLRAKDVVDYYKYPEYLYFGPDENMHNSMIDWIANYSKSVEYKPGAAFISSKPRTGINHKEYGVTSLGVNVYMHEVLLHLGIDPEKDPFTVKITGGPDGDVAGNQMLNLYKYYPNTAKLVAVTDISGTIHDPSGLDLEEVAKLFHEQKSIRYYPPEKLSDGGFLLDLHTKKEESAYSQQTLCYKKEKDELQEIWLSGSEMNHLFRYNVHQTPADIFIPAGGRPRTLNEDNWKDFLDKRESPTSKAIIEAANLYLTLEARYALEDKGVLIIKDSSANKGGVICSSLEVLIGLVLSEDEFIKEKRAYMSEVLDFIKEKARDEAKLMLKTYSETDISMIDISDFISERINTYTYQILDYLTNMHLSKEKNDPYIQCLLKYCLPKLRKDHTDRILTQIPDSHKKAIISCYIASKVVYGKGLKWSPSVANILPILVEDI